MYTRSILPLEDYIRYTRIGTPSAQVFRGMEADFLHMVWLCPALVDFWRRVVEELSRATAWRLPMEIKAILLGLLPKSKERKMSRKFVMLGLVLAKRRIAVRWLSKVPPGWRNGKRISWNRHWQRRCI